ncbi:MAG: hypothetical protein KatS3mg115_0878 [Candidatus Poribacteria bacterium]|nr:MAG: hypothetical protein KatS3mg115_0878 [Candidatus Poribacteria bacterium]
MSQIVVGLLLVTVGGVLGFLPVGREGGVPIWIFLAVVGLLLFRSGWRVQGLERRIRRLEIQAQEPPSWLREEMASPTVRSGPSPESERQDAALLDGLGLELEKDEKS